MTTRTTTTTTTAVSPEEARGIMAELGVPDVPAFLERLRRTAYPEAKAELERTQETVGRAWRRMARELHPDVTGGDAEKTERFVRASTVVDAFRSLRVQPPPPPRPMFRPVFVFTFGGTGGFSATSSTTTANVYVPGEGWVVDGGASGNGAWVNVPRTPGAASAASAAPRSGGSGGEGGEGEKGGGG